MASIQSNTNNTYYAILNLSETNYSISENYRDIYYELVLYNGVQNFSGYTIGYRVNIDSSEVAYHDNSGNQTSMNANSSKLIASGTKRIYHNADGTKRNVPISFEIWTNNLSYLPVYLSASGSMNLTDIPRYANFTEHYVSATGLNSISVRWNADAYIDKVQYSLNGGGWIDTAGLDYTIRGLSPNTSYNIRTRIKRNDSQLWTESGYIYGTTKEIAKITSAPNINLGDSARIIKTNPSSSRNVIRIETLNPVTTIATRQQTTDDMTINFTDSELDALYKKMGKANSITIRYVVDTYGDTIYYNFVDRICTLTGNQKTGHINVNGAYKRAKGWTNVMGSWKRKVRWINVNGTWKRCI